VLMGDDDATTELAILEAGADDFLGKTAGDVELVARVRALAALGAVRRGIRTSHPSAPVRRCRPREGGVRLRMRSSALAKRLSFLERKGDGSVDIWVADFDHAMTMLPPRQGPMSSAVVLVDDAPTQERRQRAYELGAAFYVSDSVSDTELQARMDHLWNQRQELRALASERDQAATDARIDGLTGLHDRVWIEDILQMGVVDGGAVVMVDVDHFKRINDAYGHAGGDAVLKSLACCLSEVLRAEDAVARFGGEEFLIWLPLAGRTTALEVSERLRRVVEEHTFSVGMSEVSITISVGVALAPAGSDPERAVTQADYALYQAKGSGRNRVCIDADAMPDRMNCEEVDGGMVRQALVDISSVVALLEASLGKEEQMVQTLSDSLEVLRTQLLKDPVAGG